MWNNRKPTIIIAFFIALIFSACTQSNNTPDISHIPTEKVNIKRFEQDLFSLDTLNIKPSFEQLQQKYPELLPLFIFELQQLAKIEEPDTVIQQNLNNFINNIYTKQVLETVNQQYPNLQDIENQFAEAFRYLKYHFPDLAVPQLYSFIAPFQHQAITIGNNKLAISLDMHLGENYEFYPSAGHPQYLSNNFTKQHLLPNALMAYAKALLPESKQNIRLIDKMIYNGKLLYLIEQLLPQKESFLIFGCLKEQYEWCLNNEKEIWNFWTTKKLLYETQSAKIAKYTSPAPTSAGMPPQSPGNVGSFTGWQIIKNFMQKNPDTTMEELFAIENGQQILKLSKYQP